jgi:small subunit ribosomal protein S16
MSTRIRLRRMGANKRPFYRVVVADQRSPRDGRFIEIIGKYHPLEDPSLIEIDAERALYWLGVGAQPSSQVRNLMSKLGIWETFVAERPSALKGVKPPKSDRPAKQKRSKKAQAKAAERAEVPEAPAVEPEAIEAPEVEAPAVEPEAIEAPEVEAPAVEPEVTSDDQEIAAEAASEPAEEAEAPSEEPAGT